MIFTQLSKFQGEIQAISKVLKNFKNEEIMLVGQLEVWKFLNNISLTQ